MNKPYFEMKVVKVEKEKEYVGEICIRGERKPLYIENNRIYFEGKEKPKRKGNWVNGENLDKIKFPCFCKWSNNGWVGMIIKDWKECDAVYTLVRVDEQTNRNHTYGCFRSLEKLIKDYDIHILKGKIIIFEEEEGEEYSDE